MSDINNPPDAVNPYKAPTADLTPPTKSDESNLAHPGRRFGAAFIDGIIMLAVLLVPLIVIFGGFMAYAARLQQSYLLQLGIWAVSTIVYLLINGYFLARDGQSIGKKLLGIKIVRTDGSKADFVRIVTRRFLPVQACSLIPVVGAYLPLLDALFIFRKSRKCLHDDIADTIVVNV
jgi:uncharacterized RDD family membrane protein YckC